MRYEWDEAKRVSNLARHRVDFIEVEGFEWNAALIEPDVRRDYGEPRLLAYGPIGERLYALVFTQRAGAIRVISLRKANSREWRRYEQARQIDSTD